MGTLDLPEIAADIDVAAARARVADGVVRTPVLASPELTGPGGGPVLLKAESLQRTGSFKTRGALNRVSALGEAAARGVVTASAGNHGQAVAYAARARGVPADVFMPREAAVSKVAQVERLGATVHTLGDSVDEALQGAAEHARRTGATLVHPFDDPDVVAGQGTAGLELLEDVPHLARVLVPVGGGGLASGIALAVKAARPEVQIVAVQAAACATLEPSLAAGRPLPPAERPPATIADGIAIKRPGALAIAVLGALLDGVCTVSEDEIAAGMVFLAERAKLVAEGAGAVTVAALLSGRIEPLAGVTVAVVSGGNVDPGLLASVLSRQETELGRRVRLFTRVSDRPGGLADLLALVARERVNLIAIEHLRDSVALHVRETGVELLVETRGPAHTEGLVGALSQAGYEVRVEGG